jgi:hypothetical protein
MSATQLAAMGLPTWLPLPLAPIAQAGRAIALVNKFPLRDTSVHTFYTDPEYISMPELFGTGWRPDVWQIWAYNTTNQSITLQAVGNVTDDGTFPDFSIGSSFTVGSGQANMAVYPITTAIPPFVSVQVSASTAPSTGYVYALLIMR